MRTQSIVRKTIIMAALCAMMSPMALAAATPAKASPSANPAKAEPAASPAASVAPTPQSVLDLLTAGNKRFAAGKPSHPDQSVARRTDLDKNGQHPMVTVLTCSDSRVPPELLFDAGLGDLFIVRVAGNVADTDEIGSMEYGVEHLGTPVLMVLGHSKCGAVTAVFKGDKVGGSIPQLVDNIVPAVNAVKAQAGPDFSDASLELAIKENVRQSVRDILGRSAIVRELVEAGKLKIVGAVYHLDTGSVETLGVDSPETVALAAESTTEVPAAAAKTPDGAKTDAAVLESARVQAENSSVVVACVIAVLLALACWFLLFAERTRVKRIKFKPRLILGVMAYLVLIVTPLVVFMTGTGSGRTLSLLFALSTSAVVLIILVVSLNTLSNHLGRIYHVLKHTIGQYKGTEHE